MKYMIIALLLLSGCHSPQLKVGDCFRIGENTGIYKLIKIGTYDYLFINSLYEYSKFNVPIHTPNITPADCFDYFKDVK